MITKVTAKIPSMPFPIKGREIRNLSISIIIILISALFMTNDLWVAARRHKSPCKIHFQTILHFENVYAQTNRSVRSQQKATIAISSLTLGSIRLRLQMQSVRKHLLLRSASTGSYKDLLQAPSYEQHGKTSGMQRCQLRQP